MKFARFFKVRWGCVRRGGFGGWRVVWGRPGGLCWGCGLAWVRGLWGVWCGGEGVCGGGTVRSMRVWVVARVFLGVLCAGFVGMGVEPLRGQNFTGNAYDVLSRALAPYIQAAFPNPQQAPESGLSLRFRIAAAGGVVPASLAGGRVRIVGLSYQKFFLELTPPSSEALGLLCTPEGVRLLPASVAKAVRVEGADGGGKAGLPPDLSGGAALLLPALLKIPDPNVAEVTPHADQQVRHIFSTLPVEIAPAPVDDPWRVTWWVDDKERFRGLRVARQGIEVALYLLDARKMPAEEVEDALKEVAGNASEPLPVSVLDEALEVLFRMAGQIKQN